MFEFGVRGIPFCSIVFTATPHERHGSQIRVLLFVQHHLLTNTKRDSETHGSDCAEAGDGPQPQHSRLRLLNISHHSVAGLLSSLPEHHLLIFPVLGVVKGGDVRESCQKINMDRLGWAHIVDEWLND